MSESTDKLITTASEPVWKNNPISIQYLGICSALAVTVQMKTAIIMSLSLMFVVAFSNLTVSLLRSIIPRNIRILVELVIISTLVILADQVLRAFLYDISKQLSIFVGLIITNCIVMGRAETYALNNPPIQSFADGIGSGMGYGLVLTSAAFLRELFGSGSIMGYNVIPSSFYDAGYENMGLMLLAPGAFIIIGLFSWMQQTIMNK
ncbi:MAG: NADH:ubiquinone reductase (Na(+)-transporting) subunit D [Desulfobacterales bacterium]|nr:NADH:ubiquinone reductase (Na(+)-transporting) subunit D [Desulfobacterales bacterium]